MIDPLPVNVPLPATAAVMCQCLNAENDETVLARVLLLVQ